MSRAFEIKDQPVVAKSQTDVPWNVPVFPPCGERFDALLTRKDELSKSNEYYHEIHPTEATEVDTRLAEAAAAKKKPAAPATPAPPVAAAAARAATSPAAAAAVKDGPVAVPAPPSQIDGPSEG